MSSSNENGANGRVFNNADSFGIAFDAAWVEINKDQMNSEKSKDEKIDIALQMTKNHPFVIESNSKAIEVAKFRIRLLNLE